MPRSPLAAPLGAVLLVTLLLLPGVTVRTVSPTRGDPTLYGRGAATVSGSPVALTPPAAEGGRPLALPPPFHGVDRSGTEYACIQGWGFGDGPYNLTSVQAIRSWNATAVRVPLNEDCWLDINVNGTPAAAWSGASYRAFVMTYVHLLESQGIRPILDLHWNAPGTNQSVGQEPMADASHAPAFWSSVAGTFRNDSLVIFDLYNEPHDVSWSCWQSGCFQTVTSPGWATAGMQQLVDAVRAAGAVTQMLMLGGLNWSNDLSGWLTHRPTDPAGPGLLAASAHVYNFNACGDVTCWNATLLPLLRAGVPVITGELGESDCNATFIDRYFAWADPLGVAYLGWTWDAWNTCAGPTLIADYAGTPYQPYGTEFRRHLLGFPAPAPTAPLSPTHVAATPGNASVTLAWQPPVSNGTWPVAAYQVGWGTSPGVYTSSVTVPAPGLRTVIAGLTNGRTYDLAARAGNVIGWGPWSSAVTATPRANLSVTLTVLPTSGTAPLTAAFHVVATGGSPPWTFTWAFGDGQQATGSWANHSYGQPGSYPISLVVNDTQGTWGPFAGPTVQVGAAPLRALLSSSGTAGEAPWGVAFNGSGVGGTPPYVFVWRFGDGTSSSLSAPVHRFPGNRTYAVRLWVNDSAGLSALAEVNISVWSPLTASAIANATTGPAPLSVALRASAQGGVPGYVFAWSFGDGSRAGGPSVTHTYGAPGVFVVVVTVKDAAGDQLGRWLNLTATAPAPAPSSGGPAWWAGSTGGIPTLALLVAIGAGGLVGAIALLLHRRRRDRFLPTGAGASKGIAPLPDPEPGPGPGAGWG